MQLDFPAVNSDNGNFRFHKHGQHQSPPGPGTYIFLSVFYHPSLPLIFVRYGKGCVCSRLSTRTPDKRNMHGMCRVGDAYLANPVKRK